MEKQGFPPKALKEPSLSRHWLYTLNLFFIIYTAITLGIYLLGPDSGRLSTLKCKPNSQGKSVCTVKIFGVRKIYRRDFYAKDYIGILASDSYPHQHLSPYLNELALPWGSISGDSTSDGQACAVAIRTGPQVIDFVPPYQSFANCKRATEQIETAFAGDRNKIDIQFNGYNPYIYVMAGLIVFASILFVGQTIPQLRHWIRTNRAARGDLSIQFRSGAGSTEPELRGDAAKSQVSRISGKAFVLKWWATTALVLLFIIFSSILLQLGKRGSAIDACFLSIRDYQGLLLRPLLRNLVVILPLIALTIFLATLQWQVLRLHIRVSRWWIAAPIIAGIPILIGLPSNLHCGDVSQLSLSILIPDTVDAVAGRMLTIYLLLVGFVQWLALRKVLKFSLGWIFIPLEGAVVLGILFIFLFGLFFYSIPASLPRTFDSFFLPYAIVVIPLMFFLLNSFSLLAGYYLYRLIRLRGNSLLKTIGDGDQAVAG